MSPKGRQSKNKVTTKNQTYVDIDEMTVIDLEKLEQSPPRINPRRKNMKVMNNKAMSQFGADAFNVKVEPDSVEESQ